MSRMSDHVAYAIRRAYVVARRLHNRSGNYNVNAKYNDCWEKAADDVRRLKANVDDYVEAQFAMHHPFPSPERMYGDMAIHSYEKFMAETHRNPRAIVESVVESEWLRFKSRLRLGDSIPKILESPAAAFTHTFQTMVRQHYGLPVDDDLRNLTIRELVLSPAKLEYYAKLLSDDVISEANTLLKG